MPASRAHQHRTFFSRAVPRITQLTLLKLKELPVEEREAVIAITRNLPGVTAAHMGRALEGDAASQGFTDAIVCTVLHEERAIERMRAHPDSLAVDEILSSFIKDGDGTRLQLSYEHEHEAFMKPQPALALGLIAGLVIGGAIGRGTAPSVVPSQGE